MNNAGEGILDDLRNAFDPNRNGVAKAFDPKQNGVAKAFAPGGSAQQFGNNILQGLRNNIRPIIHTGVDSGISALTEVPLSGTVIGQLGLNSAIDKGLDKANLGFGLKPRRRFEKGSQEAKEYMASLRKMRGKGLVRNAIDDVEELGTAIKKQSRRLRGRGIPGPHSRSPITDPTLL